MRGRGLFLDRDGVVNEDRGYVHRREDFVFMPRIFEFLRAAQDDGWRLIVVTNQSGVGRGMYSASDYAEIDAWMRERFRREGITIDATLACFVHPTEGMGEYRRGSFWRKPNPGMILEAALRLNLDLSRSAMIGDGERDIQAAEAAGIRRTALFSQQAETATHSRKESGRSVGFKTAADALGIPFSY